MLRWCIWAPKCRLRSKTTVCKQRDARDKWVGKRRTDRVFPTRAFNQRSGRILGGCADNRSDCGHLARCPQVPTRHRWAAALSTVTPGAWNASPTGTVIVLKSGLSMFARRRRRGVVSRDSGGVVTAVELDASLMQVALRLGSPWKLRQPKVENPRRKRRSHSLVLFLVSDIRQPDTPVPPMSLVATLAPNPKHSWSRALNKPGVAGTLSPTVVHALQLRLGPEETF